MVKFLLKLTYLLNISRSNFKLSLNSIQNFKLWFYFELEI